MTYTSVRGDFGSSISPNHEPAYRERFDELIRVRTEQNKKNTNKGQIPYPLLRIFY